MKALLASGGAALYDIQSVHDDLVNGAVAAAHALSSHGGASGSPGAASSPSLGGAGAGAAGGGAGGGGMEDPTLVLGLPPSHPLAQLLSRQPLGAALVSRCVRALGAWVRACVPVWVWWWRGSCVGVRAVA